MDTDLVIDLDAPQDGVVPSELNNLHEEQLKEAVRLIRRLAAPGRDKRLGAAQASAAPSRPRVLPTRRGLLIEGERGIGKTSFLYALGEAVNDYDRVEDEEGRPERYRVHPLPLLDPTLISGDRSFIAAVIANILGAIERSCGAVSVCDPAARQARDQLNRCLEALHNGLKAEDEETWRRRMSHDAAGHTFVDGLLQMARGGIELAERFESFCRAAADMLGADMLLQPLDDVDLAGPEAYTTLEAVRRYMTGPSLLPVVAGDLQQFVGVIWEQRLAEEQRGLKAREGRSAGERQQREDELRGVAAQHLDKLLPPPHRFPLASSRRLLLAWGHCEVGGARLPVLGGRIDVEAPLRDGCLVGRAEAALVPSPGARVSGALLGLVPENTRGLISALRLFRDAIPSKPRGQASASPHTVLRRFAQMFAASLTLVDLRTQDVALLAAEGPRDSALPALRRVWPDLASLGRPSMLAPGPLEPARALVTVALAQWIDARPARALILMGMHAPYIAQAANGATVGASPGAVDRGVSAAGQALAAGVVPYEGPVPLNALYWRQSAGLWLREVRANPKPTLAVRATFRRLRDTLNTMEDELAPFHEWLQSAKLPESDPRRALFLRPANMIHAHRPDAALLLHLARTYVPTTGGRAWMVDPCRPLEAAARLLASAEANPSPDARRTTIELINLYRDDAVASLDGAHPPSLEEGRADAPAGLDRVTELFGFEAAVDAWRSRQPDGAPLGKASPAVIVEAHRLWRASLADISDAYLECIASVGGYMQRATVALLGAAMQAELGALGGQAAIVELLGTQAGAAWVQAQGVANGAIVYALAPGKHAEVPPTSLWRPAGRTDALIEVLLHRPPTTKVDAAAWLANHLPLSTLIATCPLLVGFLSAAWRRRIGMVWHVPPSSHSGKEPDVFTLLSGIPIPPHRDDADAVRDPIWLRLFGEHVLSPAERQMVAPVVRQVRRRRSSRPEEGASGTGDATAASAAPSDTPSEGDGEGEGDS